MLASLSPKQVSLSSIISWSILSTDIAQEPFVTNRRCCQLAFLTSWERREWKYFVRSAKKYIFLNLNRSMWTVHILGLRFLIYFRKLSKALWCFLPKFINTNQRFLASKWQARQAPNTPRRQGEWESLNTIKKIRKFSNLKIPMISTVRATNRRRREIKLNFDLSKIKYYVWDFWNSNRG